MDCDGDNMMREMLMCCIDTLAGISNRLRHAMCTVEQVVDMRKTSS